ncbi:hypothetical protein JK359_33285 [Streptomyces actinomycinicus]|uniref:Uncharacterized protein n=1 Tax=Streptomyces actinomycinicus TaxID=1695166 RepID=A0A937EPN2_9ACTN|nr:hypothetical protein [Streptomyces actinomycinicus]MBL1086781.1 hypothetical protein [Streptomyces actinomycinicus]
MDQLSNAACQLTGESLEDVRRRLSRLDRFDQLVPSPSAEQALLEAVLVSALGSVGGQTRPFGVREAKPTEDGLVLRLERSADVQSLFGLLPCRTKKGPWRGVRGLTVQMDGARLRFGLRPWAFEASWRSPEPAVWVSGPHGEDLSALLAAHTDQVAASGHVVQWDPLREERGPGRREPVERSLLRRLIVSRSMGSALLRRPRLWDSLTGYVGVRLSTEMADHGLDWLIERQVAGGEFDEERLIEVLEDRIVGCGLRLLDHACGPEECTVRMAPHWSFCRGVFTIRSSRVSAARVGAIPGPRPLTAVGDGRNVSRPRRAEHSTEPDGPERTCVVQLLDAPSGGLGRDHLVRVAERIAAVWAARGLAVGLLLVEGSSMGFFRDPGRPEWATAALPKAVSTWTRLRLAPSPGQLWSMTVSNTSDAIGAALQHAPIGFDQVFLIGAYDGWMQEVTSSKWSADLRILVHHARPFQRHIPFPGKTTHTDDGVPLTPAESAVLWRSEHLGRSVSTHPLNGLLLLTESDEAAAPDEFDLAVEEQLARYGTPVLGRFPDHGLIMRGRGHSDHPPTVLDPQAEPLDHAHMAAAADALHRRLWGDLPSTAARQSIPTVVPDVPSFSS